jgi:hypothetical protein
MASSRPSAANKVATSTVRPMSVGVERLGSTRSYTSSMNMAPESIRTLLMPLSTAVPTKAPRQAASAAPSSERGVFVRRIDCIVIQ